MKEYIKNNLSALIIDFIGIIISIFLVLGITFWFHACGKTAAGTYMNCHDAETLIKAIAYIILCLSIIKLIVPSRRIKMGVSIGIISLAILMILVPTTLISLCTYETMVCHTNMKPWTIVFGLIFIAYELFNIIRNYFKTKGTDKNV